MSDMQSSLHAEDDLMIVKSIQDVEPIIDDCRMRQDFGATGSSDMKHAARLPMVLIEQYCNLKKITFQEWIQNKEHIKAMLNDPDLAAFRVWKGAV